MPETKRPPAPRSQPPRDLENRLAYATPQLVEYGSVAKLTRTGGRSGIDFVNMAMRVMGS